MRKINIFWFRRDLRLDDNTGLRNALNSGLPVLTVFIFDTNITGELQKDDPRISFIYERLSFINNELQKSGSSLQIRSGDPIEIWKSLVQVFNINAVYINKDYEPYTVKRDYEIEVLLRKNKIQLFRFKDQVIFEEKEVCKSDNKPYKLFTPYKNKWLELLEGIKPIHLFPEPGREGLFHKTNVPFSSLKKLGFRKSPLKVRTFDLSHIQDYDKYRDCPSEDRTTYLGPHLRFGTVSIRKILHRNCLITSCLQTTETGSGQPEQDATQHHTLEYLTPIRNRKNLIRIKNILIDGLKTLGNQVIQNQ